jgi:hypothetical protein
MVPTKIRTSAFHVMWWTTGLLLLYWSFTTHIRAHHDHSRHVALLSAVEALSAILFLIPRTMRIGAVGLLGTFAIAFSTHAMHGDFRGDLLLYASVVSFIMVRGR